MYLTIRRKIIFFHKINGKRKIVFGIRKINLLCVFFGNNKLIYFF